MRKKLLGILWDKTMDDKLMNIPNYDKQHNPFCTLTSLDTASFDESLDLIKVPLKGFKFFNE